MSNLWIISDIVETAYEMLAKARELVSDSGGSVTAFLNGSEAQAQEAISYGADLVKLMQIPEKTPWEEYVPVLVQEAQGQKPDIILVGATRRGKDLAAQLAAHLDCPCVTECKTIQYGGTKALLKRMVYGGLAEKTVECNEFPLIATVAGRTFSKWEVNDTARQGIVSTLALPDKLKVKVVERRPKPKETVNIKDAPLVVGVGRGFSEASDVKLAEELAQAMGGEVGCSRPIAEDLHWLPEDRYIGISGQVIKPEVYLAAGISGQVQHVYGIRDAKTIVVVDKNENAPIFQVADYYIVGDLKEVLPALTKAAQEAKGS
ncbi:MAG: electron transfer flavoprotein subunit alpha [Clostridiaceae bacterium BRH_c20a]|nr:MAG: electron transfer flavoprotein subunit alpha [Clostridiaceae bacterium BRH_c20a]